jgi:hypothetical protein
MALTDEDRQLLSDAQVIKVPGGKREQLYTLEMQQGGRLIWAMVLPNVQHYEVPRVPSLRRRWTIDPTTRPIKQHTGYRQFQIQCRGHSGARITPPNIVGSEDVTGTNDGFGVLYLERLVKRLDEYETEAVKYRSAWSRSPKEAPDLIFRAMLEGDSWYVDEVRFIPTRSIQGSRNTYQWSMSCLTEGRAESRPWLTLAADFDRSIKTSEFMLTQATARVASKDSDFIDSIGNVIRTVESAGANDVLPLFRQLETLSPPDGIRFAPYVNGLAERLRASSWFDVAGAAVGVAGAAAQGVLAVAKLSKRGVYGVWDELKDDFRDSTRLAMGDINAAIDVIKHGCEQLIGARGGKVVTQSVTTEVVYATAQSSPGQGVIEVLTLADESLIALAARLLGDGERWIEIAALNGTSSEWFMGNGEPIEAGTLVKIPSPDGGVLGPDDASNNIYGTDILWDFVEEDYVMDGDDPRDFATVTGMANLRQALARRATFKKRQIEFCPNFGLNDSIGTPIYEETKAYIASDLVTQFTADKRVKKLTNARLTTQTDGLKAEFDIVPIGGAAQPMSVPFHGV